MSLVDANHLYELLDEKFNIDLGQTLPGAAAELLRIIGEQPTIDHVYHERQIIDVNVGDSVKPSTIMAGAATFGADAVVDVMSGDQMMVCYECGALFGRKSDRYCYQCGTKLDGEENEID